MADPKAAAAFVAVPVEDFLGAGFPVVEVDSEAVLPAVKAAPGEEDSVEERPVVTAEVDSEADFPVEVLPEAADSEVVLPVVVATEAHAAAPEEVSTPAAS